MQQADDRMSQTSCHEDSIDVNASMVTADRSVSHQMGGDENHIDAAAASAHASNVRHSKNYSSELTYVSVPGRHDKQTDLALQKLSEDPEFREHLDTLWLKLEGIMGNKMEDTKKVLEVYGICDGEEDSETEEGQIWRMVQGDAPYTLNLV